MYKAIHETASARVKFVVLMFFEIIVLNSRYENSKLIKTDHFLPKIFIKNVKIGSEIILKKASNKLY